MSCTVVNKPFSVAKSSNALAKTWPYPRRQQYEDLLRKAATHWFTARGLRTHPKYPYCLHDWTQWPQNIILPEVVAYIEQQKAQCLGQDPFPLHKYLHHGLSSQAMLFNLVGPLLTRSDLAPLQAAFAAADIPWPGGRVHLRLEESDRSVFHEDRGQPTSIDFTICGESKEQGAPLFVEAKLTEAAFGGCSVFAAGDCAGHNPLPAPDGLASCYLHHIGRTYWTQAVEQGFADSPLARGPICPFTAYYQFFRESLFALAKGGHFVLLYDARSPVFVKQGSTGASPYGLWTFLLAQAPPAMARQLHAVTIQKVVAAIETSPTHQDWIGIFKEKYGMDTHSGSARSMGKKGGSDR
jgi:hypothetical protein